MAFPGQRADAECVNVVIRVLDAAVSKVTSFESELAVIGITSVDYPSILRLIRAAQL